ncbi:glycine--tRNA ligase subunit beta [Paenibacillus sp. y28]|uniref:glycine--tRNA ligase subunit beta n=1 Tax=Paenibacillus sp. y28 TaxID=3129110 RepID=UPI003017366A
MAKDLLLEIGMEEIPARFVRGAMDQLKEKTSKWLDDSRIGYESVQAFATPRRLAVLVHGVAEKQADVSEEIKGPSLKIARDESGAWSKAAQGFARGQGVSTDDFFIKEVGGVEYIYANKSSIGVETAGVLAEGLSGIITSLTFPKNMRWGSYELRYVRPIRWLIALFGGELIPFEIAGVETGRTTRGHRFLGGEAEVSEPAAYIEALRKEHVIVEVEERRQAIVAQIEQLAASKGWVIPMKEDLLEEVLFLVETPTVLFGTFNPEFLEIPQEVLITSMREHQRYFPVLDAAGKLLPYFVTVRSGNDTSLDVVAKGNEKVLRARLSDARFFYKEDQKVSIDTQLAKLEKIVFHEKLGTIGDKVRRFGAVAELLVQRLQADATTQNTAARIAAICKFDLVTQMVYEFPELQGVMGEDYARKFGEPEAVARGIFEHYQPRFSGDAAPASLAGAIVSIADKLDTITGCFSIGIIPTGSQDPYALRRQAAGIVQTLLEHQLPVSLSELFGMAIQVQEKAGLLKRSADEIRNDLVEFFALRVKNLLNERGIRYDVIDAVLASGFEHIGAVVSRADAVMNKVSEAEFKLTADAFNRVINLAAKAETANTDPARYAEQVEHDLYAGWQQAHVEVEQLLADGKPAEAIEALAGLKPAINAYFEKVMVMAEDVEVRAGRLGLLKSIADDLKRIADFQRLVW